jgi:hypothetical protein
LREYSSEKYYERLMSVYEKAIELGPRNPSGTKASRGAKGSSRGVQERKNR